MDKKDVARAILKLYKKYNLNIGDSLIPQNFVQFRLERSEYEKYFDEAMQYLLDNGFIAIEKKDSIGDGHLCYKLLNADVTGTELA